ncbi:MAG: ATP-dependent DNA ligase [Chloroflexi bacterium]|nr:MAG: ATP-dependent DNA ligase [Chloroflexota bacterium]
METPSDTQAPPIGAAPGSMAALAVTASAIGATSSKLEKVRLLAAYLRTLDPQRLPVATRYFAGRPFPSGDTRVLQIGGAALSTVLRELTGIDGDALSRIYRRHADAGDTTHDALLEAGRGGTGGLDLVGVAAAFDTIAAGGTPRQRAGLLRELLAGCSPEEARYIVKLISGDMRIGLREGLVEEAIGRAFDRPATAVARADMIIGDLGEVALLARDDRLDDAQPRLFAPMRYMLASPVSGAAEVITRLGDEVWVEDKYDGIRCQLHRDAGRVLLCSRDLKDITEQFPEVVRAARRVEGALLLDGELLAFRERRVLPFAALQTRLGRKRPPPQLLAEVPVVFVAWDLLFQDGESLLEQPLRARRERLEALGLGDGFALAHLERARGVDALEQLFLDARARRNEGLMAKDPDSAYTPGRRGLAWLKLKKPLDTLDVVVIGAEWGHGKRHGVLSDVTFAVRVDGSDELVPVGKAYTGLTDAEIAEMTAMLLERTVSEHGSYRTVRPDIVLEVAFDAVQRSARHRSGFALRFPRILRWRRDKPPEEIDTLSRVRAIAEQLAEGPEQRVDPATAEA